MSTNTADLPNIAEIFAQLLQRVPAEQQPLLIAIAERLAAQRYRAWADDPSVQAHRASLRACAAREEEIAARIEALHPGAKEIQATILAHHPDLETLNRELFAGRPLLQQFAMQAQGERLGAATWRALAQRETDAARQAQVSSCAPLEEQSAQVLEAILDPNRGTESA